MSPHLLKRFRWHFQGIGLNTGDATVSFRAGSPLPQRVLDGEFDGEDPRPIFTARITRTKVVVGTFSGVRWWRPL